MNTPPPAPGTPASGTPKSGTPVPPADPSSKTLLPGMAAIALWMLATAFIGVLGVLGHRFPPGAQTIGVLLLSTLFVIAGFGLTRRFRWGWALSLAAVFLSMVFFFWSLFRFHQIPYIVMATVNLIFFLYLVRPEVRERLR
jgi:hypothetical protein